MKYLIVLALLLSACGGKSNDNNSSPFYEIDSMGLFIDPQTGCHYFVKSQASIMPRLDENGKHMGCKK